MATTKVINDLIDLNQTGNTTALKGCVGTNANQPADPTISVQYLVVGGGGGGGSNGTASGDGLGGGGAGGLSTGTIAIPNNTTVNIVVGQGGLGGGQTSDQSGTNGQDSGFYQIQGQGGGGGGEGTQAGFPGGSGGGGGRNSGNLTNTGVGVSGQGNNGGLGGYTGGSYQASSGGGGGGASTAGAAGGNTQSSAGAGGTGSDAVALGIITQANGTTANIGEVNGATLNFSGGGGGGQASAGAANDGGLGGGGNGGTNSVGSVGTANTGGGGGGDGSTTQGGGGTGGSGVVILKYANTTNETIAGSLAGGITTGTTGLCSWPTSSNGVSLFQLENNITDTCGNSTASWSGTAAYSSTAKFGSYSAEFSGGSGGTAIDTGVDPDASSDWTVSMWMYRTNTSAFDWLFGSIDSGLNNGFGVSFYNQASSGKFDVYIRTGGGNTARTQGGETNFNTWEHIALTHNSSGSGSTTIYQNGKILTGITLGANPMIGNQTSPENWFIGSGGAWNTERFKGYIDQARFYDTELTATEIQLLYAESAGATKFTESSDTVLVFKAGSGTINLTDTSLPGPKVGDLRTNTDQTSNSSASAMEHYTSTGWRVLTNTSNSTLSTLNYPPGKTAMAVYPLQTNTDDVSTNYNATNVSNNITFPGSNGFRTGTGAASFNGSSSVGLMQNSLTAFALQEFTYSVWIKPAVSGNYGYLWSNYSNGGVGMGLVAQGWSGSSDKKVTFWWRNGGSANPSATLYSNGDLTTSAWQHVCVTYSNTSGVADIYINGNNTSLGSSNTLNSNQHPVSYGNLSSGGRGGTCFGQLGSHDLTTGFYNGLIQEIRIYNSALSSTDVGLLYTQQ